jgi:hypothetical protein
MTKKLILALATLAVLAVSANYTLGDASVVVGQSRVELRVAVWIMLGGFALKTLIAWGRFRAEGRDE